MQLRREPTKKYASRKRLSMNPFAEFAGAGLVANAS
jgi:hypothetical protein